MLSVHFINNFDSYLKSWLRNSHIWNNDKTNDKCSKHRIFLIQLQGDPNGQNFPIYLNFMRQPFGETLVCWPMIRLYFYNKFQENHNNGNLSMMKLKKSCRYSWTLSNSSKLHQKLTHLGH